MKCRICGKDLSRVEIELVHLGFPQWRHSDDNLFACFDENLRVIGEAVPNYSRKEEL